MIQAQMLLLQCHGDEIWDATTCRERGVPESWIAELSDCFESGFQRDDQTIYVDQQITNQYAGVHDLSLAYKLAEFLDLDWRPIWNRPLSRQAQVAALIAELDEL